MDSILKQLIKLSVWNTSAAGINFLTNLLIVGIFGLEVFGDLAYISSLTGLLSLVYLLLPSNFSIIRYQEDPEFRYLFTAFYLLASLGLLLICLLLHMKTDVPFWLFFLYSWSFCLQSYFDISLQAENRLQRYYFILFMVALSKAVIISAFFFLGGQKDFFSLVLLITIAQGGVMFFLIFMQRRIFSKSFRKIPQAFQLIIAERKLFGRYYMSLGLNRLNANIIILLFAPLVGKEILGTYSLLMKVYIFITGLIRTLESLFINKISNKLFKASFMSNIFKIGISAQLIYLVVGAIYMKYLTGQFYIFYMLLFSSTIYLYLFYIKARADLLIQYKNRHIIVSNLIFIVTVFLFFGWQYFYENGNGLHRMVYSFIFASTIQMAYLVWAENSTGKNTGIAGTELR